MDIVLILGFYALPVLSIVFCLNFVSIIRKVKNNEGTTYNTIFMTGSFTLLIWYFASLIISTAQY
ncbi:hypothetical protein [Aquibacillus rhizosphaerae]|uniref:Uncharacterized protein n=1 Tax=Aquibacillus rhizosphaerae TaxID=3051431 RepID=A0ABT7L0W1_9BACI|nr:hypothetical protein [Aquibacillus sp. LR5S19]MDL4839487.1 hypothetical protein [Aquibacillus sp. LR5S19]